VLLYCIVTVVVVVVVSSRLKRPGYCWSVQRVEEPFILAVKEELGDRFTISVETIYRTTIRYILSTLTVEFRQSRQQLQQPQQSDSSEQLNNVAVDAK